MHKASCLCGEIKIEINADLPKAIACHCTKCRKWSGNYGVSVEVPRASLSLQGNEHLVWFNSSEKARRGFCAKCGSSLLFDPLDTKKHDWIGVLLGALEGNTQTRLGQHIFVAEKGDWYDLTDDVPKNDY